MRKFDILAIQYLFSNKRKKCSDAKSIFANIFKNKKKKVSRRSCKCFDSGNPARP